MVFEELQEKGWRIDENALTVELDIADESHRLESAKQVEEFLLNSNLHDVAVPALVNQLDRKNGIFTGPLILQLTQWRNVSHSLISKYEKNDGICILTLNDGHSSVRACQMSAIMDTHPTEQKVLLSGRIRCECGLLLLDNKNTRVLGGVVESLVEKWKSEKFRERAKALVEAPKWVPFSKAKNVDLKMDRNFNAMKAATNTGETNKEDDEKTVQFNAERRARIEALDVPAASVDEIVEAVKKTEIKEDKKLIQQLNARNNRFESHQQANEQSSSFCPSKFTSSSYEDRKTNSRSNPSRGRTQNRDGQRGGSHFNQRNEGGHSARPATDSRRNQGNFNAQPTDGRNQRSSRGGPRSRGSGRGRGNDNRRGQNSRPATQNGNNSNRQNMAVRALKKDGWPLDEGKLRTELQRLHKEQLMSTKSRNKKELLEVLLDLDLTAISTLVFPADLKSISFVNGPLIVQLIHWRNVSHSILKDHEGNTGVCCLSFLDGERVIRAFTTEKLKKIDGKTPYGAKILLDGTISVENGLLLLNSNNTKFLGGEVASLRSRWLAEKTKIPKIGLENAPKWIGVEDWRNTQKEVENQWKDFNSLNILPKTPWNQSPTPDDQQTADFKRARKAMIDSLVIPPKRRRMGHGSFRR
ncbi:Tudor domain-containing protein [Aphelenchoides besseyi]|nr:Tudor domain-containing protein [Aphelenchoides besseyi]